MATDGPTTTESGRARHLDEVRRTTRSALWAAWGDAIGFPFEVIRSPSGNLRTRVGRTNGAWKRRVGGRFGPVVELPAGTYSDDTQLRLSVSRCIRAVGRFDAEAFSKIELPVFLAYQLGAGRATRGAAEALGRRSTRWYANFFDTRGSRYVDGGGNGAAMRVQPHVWAAEDFSERSYLPSLVRDVLVTHGHPRALVGAALHANSLARALATGEVPEPDSWIQLVEDLRELPSVVEKDEILSERWLPLWEKEAERRWAAAVVEAVNEATECVDAARVLTKNGGAFGDTYQRLAEQLGGLTPETRGSGVVSAALSLWIAWTAGRGDPAEALRVATSLVGSDTDTIGTIAGAIVGATTNENPPGPVADEDLHVTEAVRLRELASGSSPVSFPHPDPLHWQAPATHADAVGTVNGSIAIAGLGIAQEDGPMYEGQGRDAGLWQWLRLDFGQRVLVKRRAELQPLPASSLPRTRLVAPSLDAVQPSLLDAPIGESEARPQSPVLPDDVEDAVRLVVERRFDRVLMSRLLVHFAKKRFGVAQASAFAALLAREIRQRNVP